MTIHFIKMLQARRSAVWSPHLLRLEADVPTFGGLYFDGKGRVVLLLTDLGNPRVATVHLRQHMAGWLLPTEARHLVDTDQGVVIQQAQFRFSSLVSWSKQLARDPSLRQYGMVSLDADEARNRIAIGLVDLSSKDRLLASAARLGIPTEAIVITPDQASMPSSDLRDNKRPTGAGVQVENALWCSLGWNVTDALERVGFLTAGHCLSFPATGQGGLGATFGQPTTGAPIGTVVMNAPWNRTDPECLGYPLCTAADALFVQYSSPSNGQKRVAHTEYYGENNAKGSITFNAGFSWYNNVSYPYFPYAGLSVDKVGRSTGWTRGVVGQTCVTREFRKTGDPATWWRLLCANSVTGARFGQGDSGGPVFFAASTFFDYIQPLGIALGGDNMTTWDSNGFYFCSSNCTYWFTDFAQMNQHLGTTFYTAP